MDEEEWRALKDWAELAEGRPRARAAADRWLTERVDEGHIEVPSNDGEITLAFSAGVMWALGLVLKAMPQDGAKLSEDAAELDRRITAAANEAMST